MALPIPLIFHLPNLMGHLPHPFQLLEYQIWWGERLIWYSRVFGLCPPCIRATSLGGRCPSWWVGEVREPRTPTRPELRALRTLRDNTEKTTENIQRTWERTQERTLERMGRENNQRTLAERTFTHSPTGQIFHGNKHQSVQSLFWPKYIRRLPILEESWWNIC